MEIKAPPLESLTCVRSTIFAGRYPRMTVTVSSGFIDKADCPYSGMFRGLISCWPGSAGKEINPNAPGNPSPLLPLLVLFEAPVQRLLVVQKIGPRQLKALFQLVPPAFDIAFQQPLAIGMTTIMGFLLNPFALFDQLLFLGKLLFLEQQIPCSLFLFL